MSFLYRLGLIEIDGEHGRREPDRGYEALGGHLRDSIGPQHVRNAALGPVTTHDVATFFVQTLHSIEHRRGEGIHHSRALRHLRALRQDRQPAIAMTKYAT